MPTPSPTSRRSFLRGTGALAASAAGLSLSAACGRVNEGGGDAKSADSLNLGLSIPFLTTPFFAVMVAYVKKEVKERGIEMLEATNANQEAGKQLTDVRNLITSGATGILAGLVDNKAIKPALEYATQQKVPFIAFDDAPAAGKLYAIVRADNLAMGATAAQQLGKLVKGKGRVLSLQGELSTTNGRDRTDGFREYMKKHFPRIEVIERPAKWQGSLAGNITSTILSQYPDLAGIYIQADTTYWAAVSASLKSAGRLHPAGHEKHLPAVAIDGGAEGLKAVRTGTLDALVSQPLDNYAKYGVEYLEGAIAGKKLQTGKTDHDSEIVEYKGNLMDLLPAPLVTKENVDDSSLWGNSPLAK